MKRNYDKEGKDKQGSQYAYSFDYDVMHPYMVKTFRRFFVKGNMLELGSYQGALTKKLLPYFEDITCVEGSGEAIVAAQNVLNDKVKFIHGIFEEVTLPGQYDNILLTHVLEHLDDPVQVLRRINEEWLSAKGRLIVACPNANAVSRQIAVKMRLLRQTEEVTAAEAQHGHRRTYTLDTLVNDAKAAGLAVVHRSGIFFKALANFQWDKLLKTDIISAEYLEGCYELGEEYPELCSSIFVVCEKGRAR